MLERDRSGPRVGNYWVKPVRYSVAAGSLEEDQWGAHLIGVLFVVLGLIFLVGPIVTLFGRSMIWLAVLLGPITLLGMGGFTGVGLLIGATSLAAGVGILFDRTWAYAAGTLLGFLFFAGAFPVGTAAAALIAWILVRDIRSLDASVGPAA